MTNQKQELQDYDLIQEMENQQDQLLIEPKEKKIGIHSTSFKDFLLKSELNRAISQLGFEHPSEVQQEALPQALLGSDIICQAKSGMGKTAVFALSILQQLEISPVENDYKGPQVIVISHTRELAHQNTHQFQRFSMFLPEIRTMEIIGGMPMRGQHKELVEKRPHIVVATPGRLYQFVREKRSI